MNDKSISRSVRSALTRLLIRMAMKTCVWGFTHDHLVEALRCEQYDQ